MAPFNREYRPIHKGVSIVGKDAYKDYRETSKIRDPKKFTYYTDYRRIARKIWKRISKSSIEYESGVYAKDFFYIIPQVIDNKPFIELPNGKIKSNFDTDGDMYAIIFCNIMKQYNHFCWSLDGCTSKSLKTAINEKLKKTYPKYYFILPDLLKNNL